MINLATYHNILVPLDGYPFAENAIPLAARIARAGGARVHLIHVMDFLGVPPYAEALAPRDWWQGKGGSLADDYLEQMALPLRASGLDVSTSVRTGQAVPALIAAIRDLAIDLIVVNSHARGPVKRFWIGATTDSLTREATCPVLVQRSSDTAASAGQFRHVVVMLDGSELAEQAIPHANTIASVDRARVTLLHVSQPVAAAAVAFPFGIDVPTISLPTDAWNESAERYLESKADDFSLPAPPACVVLSGPESTSRQVQNYVEANDIDLVVMTTHGHSGITRLILGSTTDKILRGTHVPVMVVPPKG